MVQIAERDYYDVLGVSKNSSDKEIKKAYRKKALEYHPDKFAGDKADGEEKFKELNEAYSILSDNEKRQLYDRFGHAGVKGQGASARSADPFDFFRSIFDFDLGSIFGGMGGFGEQTRARQRRGPSKGDDVVLSLALTYEEAFSGVRKKVKMPFNKTCSNCQGSGAEKGSNMTTCPTCKGHGIVEKQTQRGMFIQISREPCKNCRGNGQIPKTKCKVCKGRGVENKKEEITVKIPRGIDGNEAVRVQGKGRPSSNGGLPGDLIFRIALKDHEIFERNGLDTYMRLPVDYPTLVLGGSVEVPIIGEKSETNVSKVKIPKASNLNDVVTLSKKGFVRNVRGNDVSGDAYYVLSLNVPQKITNKQKQILKELQEELQN